jgi:acyl-CoA reductase-like NAD-dependent aldehyde dehydrogenase
MQVEAKPQLLVRDKIYINGKWVAPSTSETVDVIEAGTEEVMGRVPRGGREDVDRAVAAATAAFPAWSERPIAERAAFVQKIADGLQARMDEIATVIARELGMPLRLAQLIQVGLPITDFSSTAEIAKDYPLEERIAHSLVVREPVGVVGAITPWNYPLHQIAIKVAPALAAGCTVILKPSEVAPLNAFLLAEIIDGVGLPPGVFNLVSGRGTVVGEALAAHPDVDMISFTGSTAAGRRVSELAAATIKRVTLELGGKSANIILDDADLQRAIPDGMGKCMLNSGQTCSALTRMLVPRSKLAEAEAIAAKAVESFTPGNPLAKGARLGPLVSDDQRDRVREYIRKGQQEGAKLVAGGVEPPEGLEKGYYVRPTVFSNVRNDVTIAQEEIFGPVLVLIPYDTEDEAIRVANETIYGLAGGVWSGDVQRAVRVARRMRTGQVEINGAPYNPQAPFGGFKQSGNGREQGKHGLAEFLEVKAIQLPQG